MAYWKPLKPKELQVLIDEDKGIDFSNLNLGCICSYQGKVSPVAVEDEDLEEEFEDDWLLVNKWDFLASLNRML